MNAFLAFLYAAIAQLDRVDSKRMVVTPELLISLGPPGSHDMSFANTGVVHLVQSASQSTYQHGMPFGLDSRISMRSVISLEAATLAVTGLEALLDLGELDGLVLADLFLRGGKAYQEHNYSLALITHWTIIERLLTELWAKYQADNAVRDEKTFIDGSRRKRLEDGRTFTAAVIAEVLSFGNYLLHDLYLKLAAVRKIRNDWIHDLKPVSMNDARLAISRM